MIDTHIHIIPNVDDGAIDIDMSLEMVRISIDEGVDELIATPHHRIPIFVNYYVKEQYDLLKKRIRDEKLDFKIHLGTEIHVNKESIQGLKNGMAHTLGNSDYLLMELPFQGFNRTHEKMLLDLQKQGYKIMIAHVERCKTFQDYPNKLVKMNEKGFYGQLSSISIVELQTRARCLDWIKKGLIHTVMSDGHNITTRPPELKKAYKIIEKELGHICAEVLFTDNPRRILTNQPMIKPTIK